MKRKRFSEEQIIGILKEAEAGAVVTELCRKHGMSSPTYSAWKAKYGGLEVSEARRLKALEDENARLKRLLADAMLDNAGLKDLLAYDPKLAPSNEDYLKQHPRPMLFAPGQAPGYSNYGVALAGYIVQRVSGEPFDTYVDRHIFQPLGMQHSTTAQPLPAKFEPFIAKGYRQASDPAPSPFELVVTAPAGSGSMRPEGAEVVDGRTASPGGPNSRIQSATMRALNWMPC